MERVVMHFHGVAAIVEIKSGVFVDRDWNERTVGIAAGETEDFSEEFGGSEFVVRGDDGVVEDNGHDRDSKLFISKVISF